MHGFQMLQVRQFGKSAFPEFCYFQGDTSAHITLKLIKMEIGMLEML